MVGSELEYAYIRICFDNPQFWALKYKPLDVMVDFVVKVVYKYRSEYDKYPTYDTFIVFLKEHCEEQQYNYIVKSFGINIDKDFVTDKILSYVAKQRFKRGLKDANDLVSQEKLTEAKIAVIESMEMVYNLPVNYFDKDDIDWGFETVTTGYNCFDKPLGGGGHRKNFGLIIGPSSIGKSLALLNMGAEGVTKGQDVLHITLENSTRQTVERYERRFENTPRKVTGNLHIQEFPTGGATVADFDAVVNAYRPDLLVIDYLNEVKAGTETGNTSKDLGNIARGMRALAQRYDNFVVTAQQGPKGKKFSEVDITSEDGFWSYEPAQVADVVFAMNQTLDEKQRGRMRITVDKNRNGPDKVECPFKVDYAKMLLTEVASH